MTAALRAPSDTERIADLECRLEALTRRLAAMEDVCRAEGAEDALDPAVRHLRPVPAPRHADHLEGQQ